MRLPTFTHQHQPCSLQEILWEGEGAHTPLIGPNRVYSNLCSLLASFSKRSFLLSSTAVSASEVRPFLVEHLVSSN